MIQNSSNRISKIKKKLKKNQHTDYQFLIASLGTCTNKQNYSSNKSNIQKSSLKYSIQLKKPSLINSIDKSKMYINEKQYDGQFSKINLKNNAIPFFQNVQFLENSRIQPEQSQNRFNLCQLNYQKNIQLSQKNKQKHLNKTGLKQQSNKFVQKPVNNFQNKLEAYVQFVNQLFDQVIKHSELKQNNKISRKRCLLSTLGQQIINEIHKYNTNELIKPMNKQIEVSNFCSLPSKTISKKLQKSANFKEKPKQQQFKKVILQLSSQNSKLTHLISQHQRKNIKMFIQMNQNQSKQIQKCKLYLSTLYDKYKLLQKSILKQNKKFQLACEKNNELQKKITKIQNQNQKLSVQLDRIKQIFESNQNTSNHSFEQEKTQKIMFQFNLNERNFVRNQKGNEQNLSVNQTLNVDKSFITKRQKASSCLSTHLNKQLKQRQEDLMSCSTITKTKNMKKKKNKAEIRTNFKNNSSQIVEDEQKDLLKKEILIIKSQLCKQNSVKLCLESKLDEFKTKLKKKDENIQRMQVIINQQISQIQNLIKINSNLTNEIQITKKSSQSFENKQKHDLIKDQILQKLTPLQYHLSMPIEKNKNKIKCEDEYRIIAMQAQLLQKALNFS